MSDTKLSGFGRAPIKMEGGITNPDEFTFECDLNKCESCRTKYLAWRQAYEEQQQEIRARSRNEPRPI
jgi:hypothetical protein